MRARCYDRIFLLLLYAALVILFCSALYNSHNSELTVWGDRDLWRALAVPGNWPVLGPETNSGARTPGGAFYLLLAAMLAFKTNVLAASLGVTALFALSTALLWRSFAVEVSPLAGAMVAAAFAGSGTLAQSLAVWNPGYIVAFATIATLSGYFFIKTGRSIHLATATLALAVGMQIHMQVFELAIGLAIGVLVYRRPLRWQHAGTITLAVIAAYLPAILSGGTRLFAYAASAPGEAAATYIYWNGAPGQKAQLIFNLFGGSVPVFRARAGGGHAWAEAALAAADLLAVVLAAGFASGLLLSPSSRREGKRRVRPVGLFALIVLVYAIVALVSDVNFRHLAAAIPAVAAMVGLGAEAAVRRLLDRGAAARAAAVAVCGLVALRPAALGAAGFADSGFFTDSATAQAEMAHTLKSGFFRDYDAFEAHTALFQRGGGKRWQLVQGGVGNHMAFIYRTTPAETTAAERQDCVAVVDKRDVEGDVRATLATSPVLAGLAPIFDAETLESPHFLYLTYRSRDGNCLKTFPNAYVPTAFEAAHLSAGAMPSATSSPEAAVFVAPQTGHPFPLGLEIRRDGEATYRVVLHGRLLRGYTGLYYRSIIAPTVCLVGRNAARTVAFGNVTVGSPQLGSLAPWQSPRFTLPDDVYEVWLLGREGREPGSIAQRIGRLSVPDLAATISADGMAGAAPETCFPQGEARRDDIR